TVDRDVVDAVRSADREVAVALGRARAVAAGGFARTARGQETVLVDGGVAAIGLRRQVEDLDVAVFDRDVQRRGVGVGVAVLQGVGEDVVDLDRIPVLVEDRGVVVAGIGVVAIGIDGQLA